MEPAPKVVPEPEAVPEEKPEEKPEAPVEEGKAPAAETANPGSVAAPAAEDSPIAPAAADAPDAAATPETLPALAGEAGPAAPAVPAAPPELAGTTGPDSLTAPATTDPVPAAPALAEAPADASSPDAPAAPVAEAAPAPADPPAPPPLSPEEEAMLAELAKSGSAVVPETETAPTAPASPEDPVEPAEAAPPAAPVEADAPAAEPADEPQLAADPSLPSAGTLPDAAKDIPTDRLPKIGDQAQSDAGEAASDLPLVRYARSFENPEAKPAFAIVLIDDGDPSLDRGALAALPFPVSFALDPNHPEAASHAAIYRKAGLEVVMIATGLPQGAVASDVEVAMAAMAQSLPETVAVMDMPDPSFQSDRPLASLVVPVIGGQGRGLLTWDEGLNAADQVARREKVPATVIFRDLDAEGETPQVIRRYLDRAAFKAAQEGKVTVVGRARPDTVAAILEWTVEGRAATVALAPLTAVLAAD